MINRADSGTVKQRKEYGEGPIARAGVLIEELDSRVSDADGTRFSELIVANVIELGAELLFIDTVRALASVSRQLAYGPEVSLGGAFGHPGQL